MKAKSMGLGVKSEFESELLYNMEREREASLGWLENENTMR